MTRSLFLIVGFILPIQAHADACDSIITHGLRNISISYSEDALVASKYYNHCGKDFSAMSDQQLAALEVEVIGYGGGQGNYSRAQSEERLKTWCTTNKDTASRNQKSVGSSQTFYQGAVSAWESCIKLRGQQLLIDPVISPDARTVDIGVVYRGPQKEGVAFSGLPSENFTCKAQTPEGKEVTFPYRITVEAVQIRCIRSAPEKRDLNDTEFSVLPRATISVQTASDPFQLYFAEQWEPPLPLTEMQRIRDDLARQDIPVGTVISSVLTPDQFMNENNPAYLAGAWALADGSPAPANSLYVRLSGAATLPDLRGEKGGVSVLDVVHGRLPHGAPINQLASEAGNRGTWIWNASFRDITGREYNGDYEQAKDQFQVHAEAGTVVAQGRTYNFKHGAWGSWNGGDANILGISIKKNSLNYYVKIN